jgi:small-conductance mechanosensitive channel
VVPNRKYFLAAVFGLVASSVALSDTDDLAPRDVLQHLSRTVVWYQHVNAIDQSASAPENLLLRDDVRLRSRQVVQTAFDFGRAAANLIDSDKKSGGSDSGAQTANRPMQQRAADADQRVAKLQSQIDALNQQIAKASRRTRATLVSQRETLAADLNLAKEFQAAMKSMLTFAAGSEAGSAAGGLLGQINELANSGAAAAALNTAQLAPASNSRGETQIFHPESAGLITLLTKGFGFLRDRQQIDSMIRETHGLLEEINSLKAPLRTELRGAMSESDAIVRAADTQDRPALEAARKRLETLTARYKLLSSAMGPLGRQGIVLEGVRGALQEWRNALDGQNKTALGYLVFRLGSLALAIVIVLLISGLLRRITFRYIREQRRRRQFALLGKIVTGFVLTLVVVLSVFSGFGSFATIAGFVTAGLAVALQNVILSVVAYFFLIGRYGLRPGDRVTIAGVNGQVIEVGLVRVYLMEFAGTGGDIHSTGRVAVFSNSVIFQPSALMKQAPGTEYAWHGVLITLAPDNDYQDARDRLTSAVESVYNNYREVIELQHENFEKSINLQLTKPKPVSHVRFTDAGFEIFIRYPVELRQMSDIDDQIVKHLLAEIRKEPHLKLASGGAPKIQAAA